MNKKDTDIVETTAVNYELLFDEQFSLSAFSTAVIESEDESQDVIEKARQAIAGLQKSDKKKEDYVLDLSEADKNAIHVGDLNLDTDKEGHFYAQFKNASGKYGKKIPVKKKLEEEGISEETLLLALQMETVKAQLEIMINAIKGIEQGIVDIKQGQRNDRTGLYYSGLSLILEARCIQGPYLKKQLYAQALKSLNDANSQMIQDVRSSIEYLVNKQYKKQKNAIAFIEEHLENIKHCSTLICRGSYVKAMAYLENKEVPAMMAAVSEYGRFLEKMIRPYVGKLSELDKDDNFIEKGHWNELASNAKNCESMSKMIAEKKQYMITMEGLVQ